MRISVVRNDGLVDVAYTRANGRTEVITLPLDEFNTIRASFSGENCLIRENLTLDMTAQCDFIEETNPMFVKGQITIEKDKVRRALGMDGLKSLLLPMIILTGIVVIVWMFFGGGSGGGGGAEQIIIK